MSLLVHAALIGGVRLWPQPALPRPEDPVIEFDVSPPPEQPVAERAAGAPAEPSAQTPAAAEPTRDRQATRERRASRHEERPAPAGSAETTAPVEGAPPGRRAPPQPAEPTAAEPNPLSPRMPSAPATAPEPRVDLTLRQNPFASTQPAASAVAPGLLLTPRARPDEKPPAGGLQRERPGFRASTGSDGRVQFDDDSSVGFGDQLSRKRLREWWDEADKEKTNRSPTVLRVDATDVAMRLAGQDPYRAEKRKMLDETREERIDMARSGAQHEQRRALAELNGQLRSIWRSAASGPDRRRLLFELWDECTEAPAGSSDAFSDAGERARAEIVRFVRLTLPAGSPEAFTVAELTALNRGRQSHQRFTPYAVR